MADDHPLRVPVLVYHRFGPAVTDTMTVTMPVFEDQLRLMRERGTHVMKLRDLVAGLRDGGEPVQRGAVVLTIDDGHRSVYTDLFPLILRFRIPPRSSSTLRPSPT